MKPYEMQYYNRPKPKEKDEDMKHTEPYLDCKTNEMVCPWCDKREVLLLPKSMKDTVEEMDLFQALHEDCERIYKRKEEPNAIS